MFQLINSLLKLLNFFLELFISHSQWILSYSLLLYQLIQSPLTYFCILDLEMTVYDIFNRQIFFIVLFLLRSQLTYTFFSSFLYPLFFELFKIKRFLPKWLAFLDILFLHFIQSLLSLFELLLLLLMFDFQTLKYLPLLPDIFH